MTRAARLQRVWGDVLLLSCGNYNLFALSASSNMKVSRIHELGGPEVPSLRNAPDPQPRKEQVLVRVRLRHEQAHLLRSTIYLPSCYPELSAAMSQR